MFENDVDHRSKLGGPYYYTLTNTPNPSKGKQSHALDGANSKSYWNSDTKRGQAWNYNAENSSTTASSNAAAFPDGVYDIKVTAGNALGMTSTKTIPVVLANWKPALKGGGAVHTGQQISITAAISI